MRHTQLWIETADGHCPTHVYHPEGSGPWPGVIGYDHTVEAYDAQHGFVPRDSPVHDEAATARHWETLLALFATKLKSDARQ